MRIANDIFKEHGNRKRNQHTRKKLELVFILYAEVLATVCIFLSICKYQKWICHSALVVSGLGVSQNKKKKQECFLSL